MHQLPENKPTSPEFLPEIIGLVPAAGLATRISPLPCSKELFPVGFQATDQAQTLRPKVVGQYLLERFRTAGIQRAFMVIRAGKWDIPAYFGDGSGLGMHLGYLLMNLPHGTPFTLDQGFPFLQNHLVALGFPDIIFYPEDAFSHLRERQHHTQADVVLGLFPTDRPQKVDMVDLDPDGQIKSIVIKPTETELQYTWLIGLWSPTFTHFMHTFLQQALQNQEPDRRELFVGDVLQAAISAGLRVEGVVFAEGTYLDIGTPDDLARAMRGEISG